MIIPGLTIFRKRGSLPVYVMTAFGVLSVVQHRTAAQMPVTKVVVGEARTTEAASTISVVGTVEPIRRSRISSEIAGRVEDMPGREGDRMEKGDIVCQLSDSIFRLRFDEEQAELQTLTARHQELLSGTRKEELARLKALLDESSALFDRWKFEMDRVKELYAGRESNDKEFFDTKAEFLAADRRRIAAQAAYDLGVEGPRKETILQAASALQKQQAIARRAEDELLKTTIRAPFSGYIVERYIETGEWLDVGDSVVEIVDLSSILVRVHVPESALAFLKVDEPVRTRIDALDQSLDGRIKHILRQADPNARTFPVDIEVENADGKIAAGMFARATVPAAKKTSVVAVPKDAVVERDGIVYVALLTRDDRGGIAGVLSPVTLGADLGEWVAISSGNVKSGAQVLTRGTERILPFPTPVVVVDELGNPVETPSAEDQSRAETGT
jgi:multidrug efflux pump subunit AcrA (membrane-fusion protein)